MKIHMVGPWGYIMKDEGRKKSIIGVFRDTGGKCSNISWSKFSKLRTVSGNGKSG